ncbi:MAG: NUDIX domain-containing protein [Terriglobales bacterium]
MREIDGVWHVALIEPQKSAAEEKEALKGEAASKSRRVHKAVLCLPKGLVDAGEKAEAAAVREVLEETGVIAEAITKLVDIKYVYVRTWGDGERVFKIVGFYLMKYVSGEIGAIAPEMRIEVKRAAWVPVEGAQKEMAYGGERKVMALAQQHLAEYGLHAKEVPAKVKSPRKRPAD